MTTPDRETHKNSIYQAVAETPLSRKVGVPVIAHRGVHGLNSAQENSLQALELSLRHGVATEIDIFFTASGDSVLWHGPVLKWAARRRGHTLESQGAHCPLSAALDLIGGQIPLLLDFKHLSLASPAAISRCVQLLTAYSGPLFAAAFDPQVLSLKPLLTGVPVGLITFGLALDGASFQRFGDYDFLNVQKDIYRLFRWRYDPQQLKLLWTFSHLRQAVTVVQGTSHIAVCDINEQAIRDWGH